MSKEIPCAGCPDCKGGLWRIVLDKSPPFHTKIVGYICADCKSAIKADHVVRDEPAEPEPGGCCGSCPCSPAEEG